MGVQLIQPTKILKVFEMLLHNRNIIRVVKDGQVANCIILKMCYDYALVKYEEKEYRIPYAVIDEVVGHELLMSNE